MSGRGHKESFWGDGRVLYIAPNGSHMGEYIYKNTLSITLKVYALKCMHVKSQLKN